MSASGLFQAPRGFHIGFWFSMAAVLVSLATALSILLLLAFAMDEREVQHSERFASALLQEQVDLVERSVSDNAAWGEAYNHLHKTVDISWAYGQQNLGPSIYSLLGIELVMLFNADDREVYTVENGELSTHPIGGKIDDGLETLIAAAREAKDGDKPATGYAIYNGEPVLLSAAPLTPGDDPTIVPTDGPSSILVFGFRLTPAKLSQLGLRLYVDQFRVATGNDDGRGLPRHAVPLANGKGDIVLRWNVAQPGRRIVTYVLPGLVLGFSVLMAVMLVVLRNNRRSAIEIARSGAKLVAANRDAEFRASHDMMTGLANRTKLTADLDGLLGRGQRLAVLFVDLDRFKPVNDGLGHAAGDRTLQTVAQRIADAGGVIAARVGGDEFVVVDAMDDDNDFERVELRCQELIRLISEPIAFEDSEIAVGASIGVALAPVHSTAASELLRYADIALYQAKESGRGTFRVFSPAMNARILERRVLEDDLRLALRRGEFELYYQPRVDAETLGIRGVEALIRWNHPLRGLVGPGTFVPIAEETGLIVPIGQWVLDEACRAATSFGISVSVNISAIQFRHSGFVASVAEALKSSGLAASQLEIELTETALLEATDSARATVDALKALGVRLAMDDFGTGYASIGYLRSFRFDVLKIDGQFIADLSRSHEAKAIVEAMVDLGQAMGLAVVAEGVETAEQLALLRAKAHIEAQGFHTGRPCRAYELRKMLDGRASSLADAVHL